MSSAPDGHQLLNWALATGRLDHEERDNFVLGVLAQNAILDQNDNNKLPDVAGKLLTEMWAQLSGDVQEDEAAVWLGLAKLEESEERDEKRELVQKVKRLSKLRETKHAENLQLLLRYAPNKAAHKFTSMLLETGTKEIELRIKFDTEFIVLVNSKSAR